MNRKIMAILLMAIFCLSGCISINNNATPVTTPVTTTPIRTSAEQTIPASVITPTPIVTYQQPCSTCGYQEYSSYQYPTYQYPCTTCQPSTTSTVIYQTPAKPTTTLPLGWEWYWDGSQWISRQIPTMTATTITPVATMTTVGSQTLDSSNVTDLGYYGSNSWRMQTFTGVSSISQISVSMEKVGNPGDVICEVGGASYRASSSSIGGKSNYVFPISATFAQSMIFHVISGDRNNFYRIYGTSSNSYNGGSLSTSENGGRTWRSYPNLDMAFSIN